MSPLKPTVLEPIADVLQMYLDYDMPGVQNIRGQARFAMKSDPKVRFTLKVVDSFIDIQANKVVVLVKAAKKLFLLIDSDWKTGDITVRYVSTDKLGIALGHKKTFSMFSQLDTILKSWGKAILATFTLAKTMNTWVKVED